VAFILAATQRQDLYTTTPLSSYLSTFVVGRKVTYLLPTPRVNILPLIDRRCGSYTKIAIKSLRLLSLYSAYYTIGLFLRLACKVLVSLYISREIFVLRLLLNINLVPRIGNLVISIIVTIPKYC